MKYILFVLSALVLAFFTACNPIPFQNNDNINVTLTLDKEYSHNQTYDFGLAQAETDNKTIEGTITYQGNSPVEISSAELSSTDSLDSFSLDFNSGSVTSFPATVSPGDKVAFVLGFSPKSSGLLSADIDISVNGVPETFTLHIQGTGNYAPSAKFGIEISQAEDTAANGYYEYQFDPQSQSYIFVIDDLSGHSIQNGDSGWELWDSTPNMLYCDYNYTNYPLQSGWQISAGPASSLKANAGIGTSIDYISIGDVLKGDFTYSDTENDLETGSIYTWSTSDSASGPWTVVQEGTEAAGKKDYTVTAADSGLYLKLTVTPIDSNGFKGTPVEVISPNTVQGGQALASTLKGIQYPYLL